MLRVAFYNVGVQQPELDKKNRSDVENKCHAVATDIAEGLKRHHLDLMCLCELGEHAIGLHGRKHLS